MDSLWLKTPVDLEERVGKFVPLFYRSSTGRILKDPAISKQLKDQVWSNSILLLMNLLLNLSFFLFLSFSFLFPLAFSLLIPFLLLFPVPVPSFPQFVLMQQSSLLLREPTKVFLEQLSSKNDPKTFLIGSYFLSFFFLLVSFLKRFIHDLNIFIRIWAAVYLFHTLLTIDTARLVTDFDLGL